MKELQSATVLMRPNPPPYQVTARATLQAKYPGLKFLEVPEDHKVLCENLIMKSQEKTTFIDAFSNRETFEDVRDLYMNHYGITLSAPRRRLLISRNRQKSRHLLNEDRVLDALRPLGFELVDPGTLDHADQVRLFNEAEAVVAVEGAALTNIVFCQPGTRVLEIRPDRRRFPYWIGLCKQMALQYRCVIGTAAGPRLEHVTVDVEEVCDQVRDMVA
jgi:capsular polysaccharide biosynthesis protein